MITIRSSWLSPMACRFATVVAAVWVSPRTPYSRWYASAVCSAVYPAAALEVSNVPMICRYSRVDSSTSRMAPVSSLMPTTTPPPISIPLRLSSFPMKSPRPPPTPPR